MGEPPQPAVACAAVHMRCRLVPPLPPLWPLLRRAQAQAPASQTPAGMMAEAYFVFSIGNLKGIFKAQYPT